MSQDHDVSFTKMFSIKVRIITIGILALLILRESANSFFLFCFFLLFMGAPGQPGWWVSAECAGWWRFGL